MSTEETQPKDQKPDDQEQSTHLEEHPRLKLSGMYQDWFLDYASYVILERAVPHVNDGLKPVQRRILHSMRRMDDGRYNKVANIIGHTMQFHPHGDASIGDALVQLGQKELVIDQQGNWGNILTGDRAAAPRYIEARLSKFAMDVLFSPKITEWKQSYDGRNKEPITLPVKFPLLLAQGVEGIAVGLNSKILPHNFNELVDGAIKHLKGEEFEIYPDFLTGGYIDVSKYNNGIRGGSVKVRAKITKLDNKTLVINDIPFGKTTTTLIESILKANEKGKIKIKKVDDNTAEKVEILIHIAAGTSSDKTIDALYAFSDCEISISPNCCVIQNNKPHFMAVNDVLKINAQNTVDVLRRELEVRKGELQEAWHSLSLEKIFIEERIYKDKEYENAKNKEAAIAHIAKRLVPFTKKLYRPVTDEDIEKLFEIKMGRILRFNKDRANERLANIEKELAQVEGNIANIVNYTIEWFEAIKAKYGKNFPRLTEIRSFENIEASKVVIKNEKLYFNRAEGFIGTGLKKDEFISNCSDIDDIIIFYRNGTYVIRKVAEKLFVGKNIIHLAVFKKNDKRTVYNLVYKDGRGGNYYMKRFFVTGVTRDKEYDVTKGTPSSRILYFTENPNGEAETIRVLLKPKPRLRSLVFEKDFSELAIKGRNSIGNILTKNDIHKISLKQKGVSTLGGRKIYFDKDVLRLNSDGRGDFLGEFKGEEKIQVITRHGDYYHSTFELSNHYEPDILSIEKYDNSKIYTVVLFDADQGYYYIKRFKLDYSAKKQNFIGENKDSKMMLISENKYPKIRVGFGGGDEHREPLEIDVDEFIGIKGFKAKGKRLTTFEVNEIKELEPLQKDPAEPDTTDNDDTGESENGISDDEGQTSLF